MIRRILFTRTNFYDESSFNKLEFNSCDPIPEKQLNHILDITNKRKLREFTKKQKSPENSERENYIDNIQSDTLKQFLKLIPTRHITIKNLKMLYQLELYFKEENHDDKDKFDMRFSMIDFFVHSVKTKKSIMMGLVQSAKTVLFVYASIIQYVIFHESTLIISPNSKEIFDQIEKKLDEVVSKLDREKLVNKSEIRIEIVKTTNKGQSLMTITEGIFKNLRNRQIIITMNEQRRVTSLKKYLKEKTNTSLKLENVYIDEGDTMICTKLSKYSQKVFQLLKLTKKDAEKNASTFVELTEEEYEKEKSNSHYVEDTDVEYTDVEYTDVEDTGVDDTNVENTDVELSIESPLLYRTINAFNIQKRKYIVSICGDTKKYFKFEVDEDELGGLNNNKEPHKKEQYELPKLQEEWNSIFEKFGSLRRICYITATINAIVAYEKERTSLFFLLPENSYHCHFYNNQHLECRDLNSMINIIDCQKDWMQKQNRERETVSLSINKLAKDEKALVKFCYYVYNDVMKKISYDIIQNNGIMLPYYSILLNGIAHTKIDQNRLRNLLFEILIEYKRIDPKIHKKSDGTYINTETFGIWIVNSEIYSDSKLSSSTTFCFSSIQEFFEKLTSFKDETLNNLRDKIKVSSCEKIHILIADDMNKRGVVNRAKKGSCDQIGSCDGGHFAAVYPRKGVETGKVQGHFEDNCQRQRSCNNSSGIFYNYCHDINLKNVRLLKRDKNTLSLTKECRKSPEMYVYMDNYGAELIQILAQDIALFDYFYQKSRYNFFQ